VLAWGRDADELAAQYAETVGDWERYRATGGTGPQLEIHPAGSAFDPNPRHRVVDKTHTRIVVSWPARSQPGR
jgi:protein-L-isoaspartate(D-aspartate) O-methyltransferase